MTDPDRRLTVSPDRGVPCPRRGEIVDLARCLACNWLLDLDRTGGTPSLRCAAARTVADDRSTSNDHAHVD
jgi:hypothetical protein